MNKNYFKSLFILAKYSELGDKLSYFEKANYKISELILVNELKQ